MIARRQASERDAPYEDCDLAISQPLGRSGGFGIFMPMSDQLAQAHAHYNALRGDMSQWISQSIRRDGVRSASALRRQWRDCAQVYSPTKITCNPASATSIANSGMSTAFWPKMNCKKGAMSPHPRN